MGRGNSREGGGGACRESVENGGVVLLRHVHQRLHGCPPHLRSHTDPPQSRPTGKPGGKWFQCRGRGLRTTPAPPQQDTVAARPRGAGRRLAVEVGEALRETFDGRGVSD